MEVKITVFGKSGSSIQHVAVVNQEGDLANAISVAIDLFRKACPDDSLFDSTIRITHEGRLILETDVFSDWPKDEH